MSKKIFIIACEPSGDSHAAHLIEELKAQDSDLEFRGLGGPKMLAEGVKLLYDMTTFSALGFGDVIKQYGAYKRVFNKALEDVKRNKPDAIILLDSPAFNLRFAKKIKKEIPTIYYISPQLWAWGGRRIHTVKRTVSKMLAILPFEKKMYDKAGIDCEFVGHPLLDHVEPPEEERETIRKRLGVKEGEWAVGLLPGSREKEVKRILPPMLKSLELLKGKLKRTRFFLTQSPNLPDSIYDEILKKFPEVEIHREKENIHDTLSAVDFALITSGTATTEAAILGTPFFLLYKASWSTYILGRLLIQVPFLGLINLLADRKVVPEFIQRGIKPKTIAHEMKVLFDNPELYKKMKKDFVEITGRLGGKGASKRAATVILKFLKS